MKKRIKLTGLIIVFIMPFIFAQCGGQIGGTVQGDKISSSVHYERARMKKEGVAAYKPAMMLKDMSSMSGEEYIEHNTEEYDRIYENRFKSVTENPLSTFSIDVDTASYSNVRRYISANQIPPKDSVRIEEMVNYFTYSYSKPEGETPFSINTEISKCPWKKENMLLHIGLQGKVPDYVNTRPSNLVFLIDSSGSMGSPNKLPLLKKSLALLLENLGKNDRVSIVAYAGSAGLVLDSTPAVDKDKILAAFDELNAGGSTAGGEGIILAYKIAKKNLIKEGNNRVILCTDGDFNVGQSSTSDMVRLIEEKRKDDIYLTICGFGMGNYKDGRMEQISNAGNGNYFYIDNIKEAKKVFVKEMRANMFTIAKDVKIQIEFNPLKVKSYRLIGYENRVMAKEDFNNDKKDAGELGAGHTVTALYEIVPAGSNEKTESVDKLKYQNRVVNDNARKTDEMLTIKMRYKPIKSSKSKLITKTVSFSSIDEGKTSDNFRFSAAVAGFGMILRDSEFRNGLKTEDVLKLAKGARGTDSEGYRAGFIDMVERYELLKK